MTRIFIIDDHAAVRGALRQFVEVQPGVVVCGEACDAASALEALDAQSPDLVLIDVSLPGTSGIELARQLHARFPHLRMAMLSGHCERGYVDLALAAGARGYIVKGRADEIPVAIRQMMAGDIFVSPALDAA